MATKENTAEQELTNLKTERAAAQTALRELQVEADSIEERIHEQAREDALEKTRAARNGESPAAVEDKAPDLRARQQELPFLIDAAELRLAAAVVAVLEVEEAQRREGLSEAAAERKRLDAELEPLQQQRNKAKAAEMTASTVQRKSQSDLSEARRRLRELEE